MTTFRPCISVPSPTGLQEHLHAAITDLDRVLRMYPTHAAALHTRAWIRIAQPDALAQWIARASRR
jgi:hypothetical protein